MDINNIAAYLSIIGGSLVAIDEGRDGWDDLAGDIILYGTDVLFASTDTTGETPFPDLPDTILNVVTGKISAQARGILSVAQAVLTLAQTQVKGKAGIALRYVASVVRSLLTGKQPPPPPAVLTN